MSRAFYECGFPCFLKARQNLHLFAPNKHPTMAEEKEADDDSINTLLESSGIN
jgi:hypothetical protein